MLRAQLIVVTGVNEEVGPGWGRGLVRKGVVEELDLRWVSKGGGRIHDLALEGNAAGRAHQPGFLVIIVTLGGQTMQDLG